MLNNIYEAVLGNNSLHQEQLDVMRSSDYRNLSEYIILKSLDVNSKTSVESGLVASTYNKLSSKYKFAQSTNSKVMGNFLSNAADGGNLIKPIGIFSNKKRYHVDGKLSSDLLLYKRDSYLKRKSGLTDVFGGNVSTVSKFVELLADKDKELLDSTPNNKSRKYYRKTIAPDYLAEVMHLRKGEVIAALDIVSGSNGVVPFVLKDEKGYYVNGKQRFPIQEFLHYL